MNLAGDQSLRFFNFVMSLSPAFGSHVPTGKPFLNLDNSMTYKCYDDERYEKANAARQVRGPHVDFLPEAVLETYPRRVMMPKNWPKKHNKALQALYADERIRFIVFPVTAIQKTPGCDEDADRKKHTCLFVYNKSIQEFEYWDDKYGSLNADYGLYRMYRTLFAAYIIPALIEHFNFEFASDTVHLPAFPENVYGKIKKELTGNYYESTFPIMYRAFLVDYIHRRLGDSATATKQLSRKVSPDIAEYFSAYMKYNMDWLQENRCKHPLQILNTETGHCIKMKSSEARKLMGIDDTCPYPSLRNVKTDRCKQINILQYFIEREDFLNEHVWMKWKALTQYFMKKFPYLSTSTDNVFEWNKSKLRKDRGAWNLVPPAGFHDQMLAGLTSHHVTHIVFFIALTGQGAHGSIRHMNCLLIDKTMRTIERFEPGDPVEWDQFNNGAALDAAIEKAFEKYGLEYLPMAATCPIGFQDLEILDDSAGMKESKNCAIWALWYMDLRLSSPLVPRHELIKTAWHILKKEGALRHFIHAYHDHLLVAVSNKKKPARTNARQVGAIL
jgi:hypothetical protein